MIDEKILEEAASLGRQYKAIREEHNLSLTQVSARLEIRSVILNDMEKGNFAHLRRGDCLAYAKFLEMDLNEVNRIFDALKLVKPQEESTTSKNKVYIGAGICALLAILIVTLCLSSSSKNDNAISTSSSIDNKSNELKSSTQAIKPKIKVEEIKPVKEEKVEIKEEVKEPLIVSDPMDTNDQKLINDLNVKEEVITISENSETVDNDSIITIEDSQVVDTNTKSTTLENTQNLQNVVKEEAKKTQEPLKPVEIPNTKATNSNTKPLETSKQDKVLDKNNDKVKTQEKSQTKVTANKPKENKPVTNQKEQKVNSAKNNNKPVVTNKNQKTKTTTTNVNNTSKKPQATSNSTYGKVISLAEEQNAKSTSKAKVQTQPKAQTQTEPKVQTLNVKETKSVKEPKPVSMKVLN